MKLAAPTDLLALLGRCGVACPAAWPDAVADCGLDEPDVEVVLAGLPSRTSDLLPLPNVLASLGEALSTWAAGELERDGSPETTVCLSGGPADEESIGLAELSDRSVALDAVRRHAPVQAGEWSCTATGGRGAPAAVEWRHLGWVIRFDERDSGGIEVLLPLRGATGTDSERPQPERPQPERPQPERPQRERSQAQRPGPEGPGGSWRESEGSGSRRLAQQVERLEKRPGALLVHLGPGVGGAMLASPLRLPRVFEVQTLSRAASDTSEAALPAAAGG